MDRVGCGFLVILAIIRSVGAASYEGLFVFGDSYADTGNTNKTTWVPPYGNTWPGFPTGRFSDGRVFTDYYASFLEVPNPLPYSQIDSTSTFSGINFAFGGGGVFPTFPDVTTIPQQVNQLEQLLEASTVSREMLESSIVLLVVAGDDYSAFLQNHTGIELPIFIPAVLAGIGILLEKLYELGFRTLAVTNMEPAGCLPYITWRTDYTTCNDTLNSLTNSVHNTGLAYIIEALKGTLDAEFISLDFYKAFNDVLEGGNFPLRPCCEGVDDHNCGEVNSDGNPLYNVCPLPEQSLFWDNLHPTNAGWKAISTALLENQALSTPYMDM